jgi:hypothetical protein
MITKEYVTDENYEYIKSNILNQDKKISSFNNLKELNENLKRYISIDKLTNIVSDNKVRNFIGRNLLEIDQKQTLTKNEYYEILKDIQIKINYIIDNNNFVDENNNDNKIIENNDKNECRAIFSINTGRSGSGYLSKILEMGKNVKSFHEPNPSMFYKWLELVKNVGLENSYNERYNTKVPSIMEYINKGYIYSESNHAFIKTFYDVVTDALLDKGCRIDIILLRRYIPDTLFSLKRTGFDKWINKYYYNVGNNKISSIAPINIPKDNEYLRILSYIVDIEAKIYDYKTKYNNEINKGNIKLHNVRLEELQCNDDVEFLFKFMLDIDYELDKTIINKPFNTKNVINGQVGSGNSEIEMLKFFGEYLNKTSQMNIKLPPLPHEHKIIKL